MNLKLALFGVGKNGKKLLSFPLRKNVEIVAAFDNDKSMWNTVVEGKSIHPIDKIKGLDFDLVLIVAPGDASINMEKQLIGLGIAEEKIDIARDAGIIEYLPCDLDLYFDVKKAKPVPFKKGPAVIYQHYEGETKHAHDRRVREGFFEKYCQGEGIDIGYGSDLIVPGCSGWDLRNGDAQYLEGVEDESFDFAYSSHCLEHMRDVRTALKNWFRVVREGGYLIVAVPHRDLYEKRTTLPSRWNIDHKHMFLIGKAEAPDTLDIVEEVRESLDGYDIKYVKTCDEGHTITDPLVHSDGEYQIEVVIQKVRKEK